MVCKITFSDRQRDAFTLVELMVVAAISLVVLAFVLSFIVFCSRSFVSLTNYVDLDQRTEMALDKMSREIRQVTSVTSLTGGTNFVGGTNLTLRDYDGGSLQYVYNQNARTLTRIKSGQTTTNLIQCDSLSFSLFQRTPSNNTFQPWPATNLTQAKVIGLTWNCSRTILGAKINTESMQSAKINIRTR